MTKKPSLAAALHEASGKKIAPPVAVVMTAAPPVSVATPSSRSGKKVVAGHFDPAVVRQLKLMALDHDTSIQGLLGEALNDLFVKYAQKPLA